MHSYTVLNHSSFAKKFKKQRPRCSQRFKDRATYTLKAFLDKKINCLGIFSMRRFFGENLQAPHKLAPAQKRTTNLRLNIGKRQVNTKVKGISHIYKKNF